MFNNWINHEEIFYLFHKIRSDPQRILKFIAKIHARDYEKVKNTWSNTTTPPTNWWDIPAVQSRWNYLISGDQDIDYNQYIAEKYFKDKHSLTALSLGCGGGEKELRWAETSFFRRIDTYDLSKERIDHAVKIASQSAQGQCINFQVGNIYEIEAESDHYDVIFAEQSLHHFHPSKNSC
ncbi:MAG: class I SAM-dependent methyltransferase [Acaryochloridaceae cyanobacterium SU_2_1]|nr:class I SAM-dependent methyltransferase [Acaryochloridaceae cyanobacterium SU_2_1]